MRKSIALLFLLPAFASAQTEIPDITNMSVEEIAKLPPEVLKEIPALPAMRKILAEDDSGISEDFFPFMVGFHLRAMYYTPFVESDQEIAKAVAAFQSDIGADVTGELTMGQFEELNRRGIRRSETKVYASSYAGVHRFEDYSVTATGTWIINNDQIADPVNTAEIECIKDQGTCNLIQASIVLPSLDSSSDLYTLHLDTQTYEIISWTANEVISRPYQTNECRSTVLTINTKSQEVYEITRNNNQEECKFGDLFEVPALDQPQVARLVSGFDTTHAYWKKRREAYEEYTNSEVRDRLQKSLGVTK